jgi:hypothetical protein
MGRNAWYDRLPNVLSLLGFVLMGAAYLGPFGDLDFAWQVHTGGEIVARGQLRVPDTLSYTITDQLTPDFEWLYEVVLWWVWSHFGMVGLRFLKVICVATPLWVLGYRIRRAGSPWAVAIAAILIAVLALAPTWRLRPMACSTVGLLLLAGALHDHCAGLRPLSIWLPAFMALWGNLHPSVIEGQALLAGAMGWEALNQKLKLNPPLSPSGMRRLLTIGGLALAASFIGPDPLERFLYPLQPALRHPIMRAFVEMQPLPALVDRFPLSVILAYAVAVLVAWTCIAHFRFYRLWEIAFLLTLTVLANSAARSLADWLLNMLALGMPHMAQLTAERNYFRILDNPLLRFQPRWLAVGIGVLFLVSLFPSVSSQLPFREIPEWPISAADWIEAHDLHGRLFAFPDYGSYLSWRLGDRVRIYVDTRGFFYPPQIVEDGYFLPEMDPDWRERLERVLSLGTDYFLLETSGPRSAFWHYLENRCGPPLYLDDQCVLLSAEQVRRAAFNGSE